MSIATNIAKKILPIRINWPHWFLRMATMRNYKFYHGYTFDLDHPKTYTEKILWYMTEYDCTEISKITDKVLFKSYIERKLGKGYTIDMLNHWDNISDFERDWDKLPTSFVLKSNLFGNGNHIRVVKDKSLENYDEVRAEVASWLKPRNTYLDNFACRMFNSKPQVLAEKFMPELGVLNDYKFLCFAGEPKYISVAVKVALEIDSDISYYDMDWNRVEVKYGTHPQCVASRPKHFDQMVEISRKLSKDFPFVRVDFYDTDEKLYVGEMTFCPGGACSRFNPRSFDEELGKLFSMPNE